MKSLKEQNRSTGRNNKISGRNYLSALSINDMSASSLDEFFSGVFKSIGVDINGTYKVSDLFEIFNEKHIKILSVCGIQCPGEINPEIRNLLTSGARKVIFGNIMFSQSEDREKFHDILSHMEDTYKLTRVKILPSFTELNQNLSIKDRYTIVLFGYKEDENITVPVITVELS